MYYIKCRVSHKDGCLSSPCMDHSPAHWCSGQRTFDGIRFLKQENVMRTRPERWNFTSGGPKSAEICLEAPPAVNYLMLLLDHNWS
ncbi:hypothetical protein AVEN_213955-1 [Araneus ventricosus]|uniref:Uncharacterized protein n=1 Tax=Araneus ventricosus TaxID=182803 RepID=A0A4Y2WWN8_ARAVE|nr:hypothetical protein AVEN_213955-1 [Araneus ventricosus]